MLLVTSPLKKQAAFFCLLESQPLDAAAFRQLPPARPGADAPSTVYCSINPEEKGIAGAGLRDNRKRLPALVGPRAGTATAHLYDGKISHYAIFFFCLYHEYL
jgi:hypothetical protein